MSIKALVATAVYQDLVTPRENHQQYYARRCAEERAAGASAVDPRARQTHFELAERYADAARRCQAAAEDSANGPYGILDSGSRLTILQ